MLPFRVGSALFSGLGFAVGRLAGKRRHVVRTNLRLCFPELAGEGLERLVNAHFRALGRGVFELAACWFCSDARIRRISELRGVEHLDAARSHGQGALLLTGHFTTLELGARILGMQRPFHAMYRPANNALVNHFMQHYRSLRSGLEALPKDDLKKLVRALRGGAAIWYAPDQILGQANAVFLPMFGVPTLSLTATSRLADMGRARVVPFFTRIEAGRYIVEVQPALVDFPSTDAEADTLRVLRLIEDAAARSQAEYFWIHRRFKARPPGMPDPYRQA